MIGQIAYGWLNHKGEETACRGDEPNLSETKRELLDKLGQEGINKGDVEVSDEMNQKKCKYHPKIY